MHSLDLLSKSRRINHKLNQHTPPPVEKQRNFPSTAKKVPKFLAQPKTETAAALSPRWICSLLRLSFTLASPRQQQGLAMPFNTGLDNS